MSKQSNSDSRIKEYDRQLQVVKDKISKLKITRQEIEDKQKSNKPTHSAEIVFDFVLFGAFSKKRRALDELLSIQLETLRIEIAELTSQSAKLLEQIGSEPARLEKENQARLEKENQARLNLEEKQKAEAEKLKREEQERSQKAALQIEEKLISLLSKKSLYFIDRNFNQSANEREIVKTFENIQVIENTNTFIRNEAKLQDPYRRAFISDKQITESNANFRLLNETEIENLDSPGLKEWEVLVNQYDKKRNKLQVIENELSELVDKNELAKVAFSGWDGSLYSFVDMYNKRLAPISADKKSYSALMRYFEQMVRYEEGVQICTQTIQALQQKIDYQLEAQSEYLKMVRGLAVQDPCNYAIHFLSIFDFTKPYFDKSTKIKSVRSSGDILLGEFEFCNFYHEIRKRNDTPLMPPIIQAISLRYLYLLYKSNRRHNYSLYAVNIYGNWIDKRNGSEQSGIIGSISASPESLSDLNFKGLHVDECFKYLKGITATNPSSPTPIRPIIKFDLNDDRLVATKDIKSMLEEGQNLANMPWEDFEHLVSQILAEEFTGVDVDIKTTKASRDKGVDAIIFDPNLITGGK